jgi:Cu-Zn family superoxide dismutase
MRHRIALIATLLILAAYLFAADSPQTAPQAVAVIAPTTQGTAKGTVTFTQTPDGKLKVVADITGLKPNSKHGFHIHEGTEVGPDGMKAAGHYNPEKHKHAGPDAPEHHAGDLGNLVADENGKAHLEITLDDIFITGDKNNVVGRAVIVHAGEDDLKTQPTGNSGARIGGGVIKLADTPKQ